MILSGGIAIGTQVFGTNPYDAVYVSSGGQAIGANFAGAGIETVYSGGTASGTTASGPADLTISHGGVDVSASLIGSAAETVAGVTYDALLGSGGTEIVASGGIASGTTIAGGTLEVLSGGHINATVFSGGGTLQLQPALAPSSVISGFFAGDKIEIAALTYSTSDSFHVGSGGVVTISAGAKTYALDIAGGASKHFVLSSGGGGDVILTTTTSATTAASAAMAFLRPAAAATVTAPAWAIATVHTVHETVLVQAAARELNITGLRHDLLAAATFKTVLAEVHRPSAW